MQCASKQDFQRFHKTDRIDVCLLLKVMRCDGGVVECIPTKQILGHGSDQRPMRVGGVILLQLNSLQPMSTREEQQVN